MLEADDDLETRLQMELEKFFMDDVDMLNNLMMDEEGEMLKDHEEPPEDELGGDDEGDIGF